MTNDELWYRFGLRLRLRPDRSLCLLYSSLSSIGSGILLFLAFPSSDIAGLAWVGLVPLLVAISGKKPLESLLLSWLGGLAFHLGLFNWILQVPGYTYVHHALLEIYLSFYFAAFGLVYAYMFRKWGAIAALISAPFVWVALEYLKSHFFFLALPWGLLAHSQYRVLPVIQIASFTGVWGISFLIVMVNASLAAIVLRLKTGRQESNQSTDWPIGTKGAGGLIGTTSVLVILSMVYGNIIISRPVTGKTIRVAVVQGNIEQNKKWDPKYATFILQTFEDLTRLAAQSNPDLIVWPETATPRPIHRDARLYRQIKDLAVSAGSHLLLGSAETQKFNRGGDAPQANTRLNSAFLISPQRKEKDRQRYDKLRLFPFGEYIPYKDLLPWSSINVPDMANFTPGKIHSIFNFQDGFFATTICWENLFPDLVRQFVENGAQFIVNITNEAWFGKTVAPKQFVSMNVFRAVENRIYVVRSANTGISCFIDPHGRIVKRPVDDYGQDIFISGTLSGEIVALNARTFYTRHGDWFAWLNLSAAMLLLVIAVVKGSTVKS